MIDWFLNLSNSIVYGFLNLDVQGFLSQAGTDPFYAMWILFLYGGWIFVLWAFGWGAVMLWHEYIQNRFARKREFVLYKITIPRTSEQTPRAAENMFISFAGGHSNPSWSDEWIHGFLQSSISVEMVSTEGQVSFYIRSERKFADLLQGAVYAQYPDAEMVESEDYVHHFPHHFPDEEWDCWGTEMILASKSDAYPLKTYQQFEDKVSGEFKDPVAYMLELMSRLGPGEHLWYQIILTQTNHDAPRKRAEKLIKELKTGEKEVHPPTMVDQIADLPMKALQSAGGILLGAMSTAPKKAEKKSEFPRLFALSPGEREVLEGVERKTSQVGFECKIRFVYVARKENMQKARAVNTFIGAMKQTNTFNMMSLKPDLKHVGMSSSLWFMKDARNDHRKSHVMHCYMNRSNFAGDPRFFLSSEELATLWHFPILLQVKAPAINKVEAKKSEAPPNLPFG